MIGWAGQTLVATAALVAVVLVLRLPVARLFGARAAYALWLAPAARLLIPPLPSSASVPQMLVEVGSVAAAPQRAAVESAGLATFAAWLWLGGAACFLAVRIASHLAFAARIRRQGRRLGTDEDGNSLYESALVEGPVASGLFHRTIVLPTGFDSKLSLRQRELALAHERLHHRRGDLWALAFSQLLLALHWFNPLAHFAHRLFRSDLESACDAQLAEGLGPTDREEYARAIIRCAANEAPRAACTLTTFEQLKRRVTMLKRNPNALVRTAGLGFAAVAVVAGAALTAPLSAQEKTVEKVVEKKMIVRGDHPAGEHKMAKCEGETFEATASREEGAEKQQTRIKLCAAKGESPAAFAAALEKAAAKIESSTDMPQSVKADILAQFQSKIAQLRAR